MNTVCKSLVFVYSLGTETFDCKLKESGISTKVSYLVQTKDKREEFLNQIVTVDETWVSYMNLEQNRQFVEWGQHLFTDELNAIINNWLHMEVVKWRYSLNRY